MLNDLKMFFLPFIFVFFFDLCTLLALTIEPDKINFGNTKKEETHRYYLKLENRTDKKIYIVGIINDCGINLELKDKELNPLKYKEGLLTFNSGTNPGYFVQNVKIIYRFENEEQIRKKNIQVSWFNEPESYSRVFVLSREIKLVIPNKRIGLFFIEAINIGNKDGELFLSSKINGLDIELPVVVPAKKNVFIKGKILPEAEISAEKELTIETKDITTTPFWVKVNYVKKDDIIINLGNFEEKEGKVYIPINIDSNNLDLHPFYIETVDGEKINLESKVLKKGEKADFYVVFDKKDFNKLKNSFFYLKMGIKLTTN